MVLFDYTPADAPFGSLVSAMKHMYVTLTTDNMPNIMLPTIEFNPAYSFYYIVFLTLTLYLLMNVLLADQYDKYRKLLEEEIIKLYSGRRESVDFAYGLLQEFEGGEEGMGVETLGCFLNELIGPCTHADGVLKILDEDGGGRIETEEFRIVAEVLADPNFVIVSDEHGGVEWLQPIEPFVEKYDQFCDKFAILGFFLTLWQTTEFIAVGDLDAGVQLLCCEHSGFNIGLFLISIAYAVELALEVLLNGWHRFMASDPFQNRFDLCTVCALMPLEIWFFVFGGYGAPVGACRMLALLRGLRCIRTVHKFSGPRRLLVKIYNGMDPFVRVLLVLFCIMYFCAQVGLIVLGGKITKENELLASTAYADSDYWPLNFNDLPSALFFLWAHLVGANSHVWANSLSTAFGPLCYVASLAFDIVCRIVLLNIIIALVIDCVLVPMPVQEDGEEFEWPDREDQLRTMFAGGDYEFFRELTDREKEQRAELRNLLGC